MTDFRLAQYQVRPQLNCVEHSGGEIRLEPRAMDLLLFLARHAGQVVAKDEILDAVWESRFITESALTRTVADLRKALGDDARDPSFIATIPKRGYRLIATVEWPLPVVPPISPEGADRASAPALDPPSVKPPELGGDCLFALRWRHRTLPLSEGEHLIGRAPEGAVAISSRKVSRCHARILVTPEGPRLEDLRSKNGTFLNGRRIEEAVELVDGDVIDVGPAKLIFRAFLADGSTETELSER